MLGTLLRWYYKNSYNYKYVVELETELNKMKSYIEDSVIIEKDDVKERKEIIDFLGRKGKYEKATGINCNFRIGDYLLYKIIYSNSDYYYSIKNVKSKKEYLFYGRTGYIKCSSNNRFVDMYHHNNNKVYAESLAKVPEFMISYI
jgi:hypothetical protein